MKIVSLVPIKMNNERLPGKNTMEMKNGKPLINCILETLNKVDRINRKYVFCSNEEIKKYLIPNIEYLKRSVDLDQPNSNATQFIDAFIKEVDADIYICAFATAPFISSKTINLCLDKILNEGYDSAFTASKLQDFIWKDGSPMNYDIQNIPRTQDLDPLLVETGGLYIFKKDVFKNHKRRIGFNPYIHEASLLEAIDIDDREDFDMANCLLEIHYNSNK